MFSVGPGGGTQNTGVSATFQLASKIAPTITWPTPAPIMYGTALSATQLDATASVPGTFVYSPPAGTVPPAWRRYAVGDLHPHRHNDIRNHNFDCPDHSQSSYPHADGWSSFSCLQRDIGRKQSGLAAHHDRRRVIELDRFEHSTLAFAGHDERHGSFDDQRDGQYHGAGGGNYQDTITVTAPGASGSSRNDPRHAHTSRRPTRRLFPAALRTSTSDAFSLVIGTQSNPGRPCSPTPVPPPTRRRITFLSPELRAIAISFGRKPVSVLAGQSLSVPILVDASSTTAGHLHRILMQISVDDGTTTLYANITVNVLQQNLPDLSLTASDICPRSSTPTRASRLPRMFTIWDLFRPRM